MIKEDIFSFDSFMRCWSEEESAIRLAQELELLPSSKTCSCGRKLRYEYEILAKKSVCFRCTSLKKARVFCVQKTLFWSTKTRN
jgi:hypothetical protein